MRGGVGGWMHRRQNGWITALVLTNVISLAFLTVVSLRYQVPQKVLNKIGLGNYYVPKIFPGYTQNNIMSLTYEREKFDIVMLGDSITNGGNWNELFQNKKIANLGIGGDSTEGVINRLSDVYALNPQKCLIMIGINDFQGNRSVEETIKNYKIIVEEIKRHDIELIIQSVLQLGEKYYINHTAGKNKNDWRIINNKVKKLNEELEKMATEKGVEFINLNAGLSANNILIEKYGDESGLHLSQTGYTKWAEMIKEILE